MILVNDLAWGSHISSRSYSKVVWGRWSSGYYIRENPPCAITHAQNKRFKDLVNMSDTFLTSANEDLARLAQAKGVGKGVVGSEVKCPLTREQLFGAQQTNVSLAKCLTEAHNFSPDNNQRYVLLDGVLCQRWFTGEHREVWKTQYRKQILSVTTRSPLTSV